MEGDAFYCSIVEFFGLARSDYKTVYGKEVSAWKPPSKQTIERNEGALRIFRM